MDITKERQEIIKKLKTGMTIKDVNDVIDKINTKGMNKKEMKKNFEKVIEDRMKTDNKNAITDKDEYVKDLSYKDLVSVIETAGTYNSSFDNAGAENDKFKKLLEDIQQLKYCKSQLKG